MITSLQQESMRDRHTLAHLAERGLFVMFLPQFANTGLAPPEDGAGAGAVGAFAAAGVGACEIPQGQTNYATKVQ